MYRNILEFFKGQLCKAADKLHSIQTLHYVNIEKLKFIIEIDKDEVQVPKTNMDEIMFYHALPRILGKEISIEEVCESLITGKNEMPLWIKISYKENEEVYLLNISKRFRSKNVVAEWHGSNKLFPFLLQI